MGSRLPTESSIFHQLFGPLETHSPFCPVLIRFPDRQRTTRLVLCWSRGCGLTRVSSLKDRAGIFETVKQVAAAEVAAPGVIPARFDSRRKWPSTTRPSLSTVTDGSPGSHNSYAPSYARPGNSSHSYATIRPGKSSMTCRRGGTYDMYSQPTTTSNHAPSTV